MSKRLSLVTGEELIRKITEGERDLRRTTLMPRTDLTALDGYEAMLHYLREVGQDLRVNPILLEGAEFKQVVARGIYLPFARGKQVDLTGANLQGANLFNGYLVDIIAPDADFSNRADLGMADMRQGNLQRACWRGTNVWKTDYAEADIRNARELERAVALGDAHFYRTRVTPVDKAIIQAALASNELFQVAQ